MIAQAETKSGSPPREPKTVAVIGNGMVGLRFCEKLVAFDRAGQYRIVTFCEEPRAAYDRVGLTSFFAHRDAEKLMLARDRKSTCLNSTSATGRRTSIGQNV